MTQELLINGVIALSLLGTCLRLTKWILTDIGEFVKWRRSWWHDLRAKT